jgi:hypothetical protein
MGPIGCPETSVNNYLCMLCNFPKEHRSHLLCDANLKSHIDERIVDISHALGLNELTHFTIRESAAKTEMTVKSASSVSASYLAYT